MTPADTEQLLQREQHELAGVISQAVTQLSGRSTDASKAALRQRAEKLSLSARITARVLTKLRLDSRYPPNKGASNERR